MTQAYFVDLGLSEGDDDEEEQGHDGDDGADVLDDEPNLASRLHLELLRHLAQDRDGSKPLALANRERVGRLGRDDVTECRVPRPVGPEVRVPPDALTDLNAESSHVGVPQKIPGLNPSLAWLLVVQHSPKELGKLATAIKNYPSHYRRCC